MDSFLEEREMPSMKLLNEMLDCVKDEEYIQLLVRAKPE